MQESNQTPATAGNPANRPGEPPIITDDTPVGPDIDLDSEVIPALADEIRAATGGTGEWPGIVEAAELLTFRIGAWHDFGYANPPAPNCKTIPPLGERSADAIKAGHGAIEVIDEITRELGKLRDQLIRELRTDEDVRGRRVDAMLAEARRACSCPESDGAIHHQRSSCTDPVVARFGWYADGDR